MALINEGGKLLLRDGKLGTGQGCCCGGCNPSSCPNGTECTPPCVCVDGFCCPGNACCYWSCDYVAELVWPDIENPEDIPDVGDAMIAAGWGLVGGQWLKTIKGEENCNDPEQAAAKFQELEGEVNGIIGEQGGFSIVTNGFFFGPGCMDCATQQECEETYLGTFHAGKQCLENPCCSGSCDEENPCKNTLSTGWDCDCVDGACAPAENPLP